MQFVVMTTRLFPSSFSSSVTYARLSVFHFFFAGIVPATSTSATTGITTATTTTTMLGTGSLGTKDEEGFNTGLYLIAFDLSSASLFSHLVGENGEVAIISNVIQSAMMQKKNCSLINQQRTRDFL